MIEFVNPGYLLLLLLLPVLVWRYVRNIHRDRSNLRFSDTAIFAEITHRSVPFRIHVPFALKIIVLALLIVGFARPRSGVTNQEITTEGIDIMLVLDISSSMESRDFRPNRLEAAKVVADRFIAGRQNDRIGLVVFAAQAFVQSPLTLDYAVLREFLARVTIIPRKYDGTAIGLAIASATNRLRRSDVKSKVIIILSDGSNNAGEIHPVTAAEMAKELDVKIYTIGAGTKSQRLLQGELDEEMLRRIANTTGGRYYHAQDEQSLVRVYEEISELEKTEIKVKEYTRHKELFGYAVLPGVLLLMLGSVLSGTVLRRLP